jgi:hypothetical protein
MILQVGYSVAGRSCGWMAPCAVCTVPVEMRSAGFLGEPQNQGRRFVSDLTSKSLGWFLQFGLKNLWHDFLVEPQNQGGGEFPSLGLKTDSSGLVIWQSKSSRRFFVWVSKSIRLRFVGCATKPTE